MNIEVRLRNRALVRQTKEHNEMSAYTGNEHIITGHVFREDGRYTTHYLKPEIDNIARFIYSSKQDKIITNSRDEAIACTMEDILDLAVEPFLTSIMPHLLKYQKAGKITTFEEIE